MKLLVVLFSALVINSYQTETYYIIKVKGDIINLSTGKHLSQGDSILATDELKFTNKKSMALVVSDSKGRFKLKYPDDNDISAQVLTASTKSALVEGKKIFYSTRSVVTNAPIIDLKDFLGEDEFTVIGNSLDVELNKGAFTNKKVIAKYEKNGREIDKELVLPDYKFDLSRSTLGVKSYGEIKLYHVDFFEQLETPNNQEKITRLDVNFIDKMAIKDEFKTIIGVYVKKDFTKPQMKIFLMEYFTDFYGKTHTYYLSELVDKVIEENMD